MPRKRKFHLKYILFTSVLLLIAIFSFSKDNLSLKTKIYNSEEFTSLHSYPKKISYKNSSGEDTEIERRGYKNQYDINDPIVRCGIEDSKCSPTTENFSTDIQIRETVPNQFKIFIAPESHSTDLTFFMSGQTSRYIFIARLGQIPTEDETKYEHLAESEDFIQINSQGFSRQELQEKDCVGRSTSEFMKLVNSPNAEGDNGGWLYVKLIPLKGSYLGIDFYNIIKTEKYLSWFNSAQWKNDDDPIETSSATSLIGDIEPVGNPDGDVDIYDYNVFIQNWGKPAANNPADIDKNNKVDIFDYNFLINNFGKGSPAK